jgi:hypothetical protein
MFLAIPFALCSPGDLTRFGDLVLCTSDPSILCEFEVRFLDDPVIWLLFVV